MSSGSYLLADQPSELERLRLQSRVWEPVGCRLLSEIGEGRGARALDVGCGVMGWLPLLSEWVGPDGEVVGTDIDDAMLAAAEQFAGAEGLDNIVLVKDDLFATTLEPSSFDLVHARFQVAPLGRGPEQLATYLQLVRPSGTVVLEDPDFASWHFNPPATALEELSALCLEVFHRAGLDPDAGRTELGLLRSFGIQASVRAEVFALPPGHPYLGLPLQWSTGLQGRLRSFVDAEELERLRKEGEAELKEPGRWGTTFTLIQTWGQRVA